MDIFDYVCAECGYEFFMEEGYNANEDVIECPRCGHCVEEL